MSRGSVRHGRSKGYILVELLVTVVILAVGILYLIDSFRQSYHAAKKALAYQQASAIVQELQTRAYSGLVDIDGLRAGLVEINGVSYRWDVSELAVDHIRVGDEEIQVRMLTVAWSSASATGELECPFLW